MARGASGAFEVEVEVGGLAMVIERIHPTVGVFPVAVHWVVLPPDRSPPAGQRPARPLPLFARSKQQHRGWGDMRPSPRTLFISTSLALPPSGSPLQALPPP